ncbi:hypothetical protein CERSUDRAFT_116626 [Gelatoporia subvermispora B]|uniref:Pentacotripeptide-repeat region of PRORP domain-containing protein n=1 Tax=Ceriporiopsis subvermispora (strain B) TaxID=914234 RepID=M2QDN3_CERS8|nr:hypothetical protein CERSUDRAFT_116626 [Gelatoporia subvermispora B]
MSGHFLLPPALLDLTLARATARLQALAHPGASSVSSTASRRCLSQAVRYAEPVASTSYSPALDQSDRSLYAARRKRKPKQDERNRGKKSPVPFMRKPVTELEARLRELQATVAKEKSNADELIYSEADLLEIYDDVLANPAQDNSQVQKAPIDRHPDADVLRTATRRLLGDINPDLSYKLLVARLGGIAGDLEASRPKFLSKLVSTQSSQQNFIPIPTGVMTNREWLSLIRTCVKDFNPEAADEVLRLMIRLGHPPTEETFNAVLDCYAESSDLDGAERFMAQWIGDKPTERQRDLHIKAALNARPPLELDSPALHLLHEYESRSLPAPQKSYTRTISTLLACRTAATTAHAWDLFAHMRYAAHPQPDAHLYALMISACATSALPAEPERALDLLKEMTEDQRIPPTHAAYCAAIRACARSGELKFVHEAFRLAKQMLDGHRDARGRSEFRPDARVFAALLEGAKRVGDLAKARWILAEMVQQHSGPEGEVSQDVAVNEPIMTHILNTYAAYKPPFQRGAAPLVNTTKDISGSSTTNISESSDLNGVQENEQTRPPVTTSSSSFTHLPPQTRAELLREVQTLFARILEDRSAEEFAESNQPRRPFRRVSITPRLINAYLSVHYAHASFETWSNLYFTLFLEHGVEPTARTHVEALERCALSRKEERQLVLPFAEKVWAEWQTVEQSWQSRVADPVAQTANARLVERANTAMIRLLALTNHRTRSLGLVKSFAARYPPGDIKTPPPKPALRSTRTVLVGAKPLVRLTSAVDVPDDTVPPLLSFTELEVLHHKLVAAGDSVGIRYIKWLCMAYQGALRRRRDSLVQALPGKSSPEPEAPQSST